MKVALVEGRPLRGRNGRVHRARARLGHSHLTDQHAMRLPRDVRTALADHWRLHGELEHSSVVAYQDLARRLALLDAPDSLVLRSLTAAKEEADHWVRCFELAGRYLGRSMRPGRLRRPLRLPRSRTTELCALTVETLRDGVLLEAYASRMAAARAARAIDWRVGDSLRVLSADEAAHAALARDVLDWLLEVGGAPVRAALRDAVLDLPDRGPCPGVPNNLDRRVLADHGCYDADPQGEIFNELCGAVRDVYLARAQL